MDRKEFDKLALFNKFALDEAEAGPIYSRMEQTLAALEPLAQADLGDAPAMVHAQGIRPVYREDAAAQTVSREEVLANAPEQAEHCFAVPRVAD